MTASPKARPEGAAVAVRAQRRTRQEHQEEKRRRILEAARRLFTSRGLRPREHERHRRAEAGVSKPTLYVYFEHKEALFAALIADLKKDLPECGSFELDPRGGCSRDARRVRLGAVVEDHTPRAHPVVRMVIAAAEAFPEIGRITYAAGPQVGLERLSAYLKAQTQRGTLTIDDPDFAALQLLSMTQSAHLRQMLFAVIDRPPVDEIRVHAERTVDLFLKVYRGRGPLTAVPSAQHLHDGIRQLAEGRAHGADEILRVRRGRHGAPRSAAS